MKNESITIRTQGELKKELKALAKKNKRKLSDYVHLVLESHVTNVKSKTTTK